MHGMRVLHDNQKQTWSCVFAIEHYIYIYVYIYSDFVFLSVNLLASVNIKIITPFYVQLSSSKLYGKFSINIALQDQVFCSHKHIKSN